METFSGYERPPDNKTITIQISQRLFQWIIKVATAERLYGPAEAVGFVIKEAFERDTRTYKGENEASCTRRTREMLKTNAGATIGELCNLTGYSQPSIHNAINRLGKLGHIVRSERSGEKNSYSGRRPATYGLSTAGENYLAQAENDRLAEALRAKENSKTFAEKAAEATALKASKLNAFRVAVSAYATKEAEHEADPSEESSEQLAALAAPFKEAFDLCAEWPEERVKIVEEIQKAIKLRAAIGDVS